MAVAYVTGWFCASTIEGSTLEAVTRHSNLPLKRTVWSLLPATSPEVGYHNQQEFKGHIFVYCINLLLLDERVTFTRTASRTGRALAAPCASQGVM